MSGDEWLIEAQTPGYRSQWKIRQVLHEEQTAFQKLQIVEIEEFGRALILDGCVQTTVGDEFIYHEMITHVPLLTHPNPERVLVIGGGDGGTVREVLRHGGIRRVDMVEIDSAVVEACRRYLPETACSFEDPRLRLHIGDGLDWVRQCYSEYDVILVDSSDPVGPAEGLFNSQFYQNVHGALKSGGLFVCQSLSPFFHQQLISDVCRTISNYFAITMPYLAVIPTYPSGLHCFVLGSKKHSPVRVGIRTTSLATRWYSAAVHQAAFHLPPLVAQLLRSEDSGRITRHG